MRKSSRMISAMTMALFASFVFPSLGVSQQSVIDTTFCTLVTSKECADKDGASTTIGDDTIDISDLETNRKGPVLYLWAILSNPSEAAVNFYFDRQGQCYPERLRVVPPKAEASSSFVSSTLNYLGATRLGDL